MNSPHLSLEGALVYFKLTGWSFPEDGAPPTRRYEAMTKAESHALPQPLFHEPVFGEGEVTPDPTGFIEPHPSDKELFKKVESLLKTQVVGFEKARMAPDALFALTRAFGARGADVVQKINDA